MNNRKPPFEPPTPHSIHQGVISRIEPFGAFVKLATSPISGLVHISQLHPTKIESVSDVVELDMDVYVKVMEVTVDSFTDDTGRERRRHRVKLSMKYVDQETGADLDPECAQMEQDLFRSSNNNNRERQNIEEGGTGGADSMLGRALASNIGMSSAIDPGNLILKGKQKGGASFNGYALVDEEEGEDISVQDQINNNTMDDSQKVTAVRPMGRGRGTTLPAWMTRSDGEDKLGSMKQSTVDVGDINQDGCDNDYNRDKRSKHRKKDRHKHNKRHKKHDRKSRRRDRSTSSSRSRSRDRRKSHKRRDRSRSRSRDNRRNSERSRSMSPGFNSRKSDFASVEEAKAIIERLERRQRER